MVGTWKTLVFRVSNNQMGVFFYYERKNSQTDHHGSAGGNLHRPGLSDPFPHLPRSRFPGV
jgi:hypothetical protein